MTKIKFVCLLAGLALLFGGPGFADACDPGNPTKGTITIKKIIVPTTSLKQMFNFEIAGPTNLSFELAGGKTKTSTVAAGDYVLSEGDTSGWRRSSVACRRNCVSFEVDSENIAFTIANGDVVACTFTNVQLGKLKIVKKTTGGDGTFAFTSGNDVINGTEVSTAGGIGEAIISDLEPKNGYNIAEVVPEGWDLTGADCSYGTPESFSIKAGKTTTCTFNNETLAPNTSRIIIKKVMEGGEAAFEFEGDVSGTISSNEGYISAAVNSGTYNITEKETDGWVLTGIECDDSDSSGDTAARTATFNVAENETVTCTFTNAKAGKITVYKETLPADDETLFSVTAAGDGDIFGDAAQDLDINNPAVFVVAAGTYSVTEEDKAGWSQDDSDCQDITVAAGEEKECHITNTLANTTATLTLNKMVVSDDGGTALDTDWTLTAAGPVTISGVEGESEISGAAVPAGDYDLSEAGGPNGYAAGEWECAGAAVVGGTVTLEDGDEAVCTITNDDIRPTLTVTKEVVNGPLAVSDFPLWVTPEGGSAIAVNSGQQNDYDAGSYTVSETNNYPDFYDDVKIGGDCASDGQITLKPGDNAVCRIDNADSNLARITVYKTVENNHGGTAAAADFDITVNAALIYAPATQKGSESGAVYYLEGGQTFAVAETGPDGYDTAMAGDCSGDIDAGDDLECRITNSDRTSDTTLTLVKEVTNDNGGGALANDWTLTAAGPSGISGASGTAAVTAAAVLPGVYTLSETGPDGYDAGPWSCVINGGNPAVGDSVTLAAGDHAVCTIANDDIAPSLKLLKVVDCGVGASCANGDCAQAGEFTLFATGGAAELSGSTPVESESDFMAGSYLLHEDGPLGYTGTWTCTGTGVFDGTDTIALGLGQSAECTVTNVRNTTPPPVKYGTLKVTKIAIGGDGTKTFRLKGTKSIGAFELTPVMGSLGYLAKASWTSGNLAVGKYTITEKVPAGWKQVFNSCKNVRVKAGKQATCVIMNIKKSCGGGCQADCNCGCWCGCGACSWQGGGWNMFASIK